MKFIGITGGVGAGKSSILTYLAGQKGIRTMMADRIAEELMEPGGSCYEALRELFAADDVFENDGTLNRTAMAAVLFENDEKRNMVNRLVHPAVKQYVLEQKQMEEEKGELDFLILEAALLIEEHYDEICDELWYIYTSKEIRIQRLLEGRGGSREKWLQVIANQSSDAFYENNCDVVIDNTESKEKTAQKLKELLCK